MSRMLRNLVGDPPYGDLTVVGLAGTGKYGRIWKCECACGNTTTAYTAKLVNGHKTSCGCQKSARANRLKRFGPAHRLFKGCGRISGSLWGRITATAKHRGIEFDISIEDAWALFEQQAGRCALTGTVLHFAESSAELVAGLNTASLDRIDSRFGYTRGNVQWVHTVINQMKWNHGQDDFVAWCKLVAKHARRK